MIEFNEYQRRTGETAIYPSGMAAEYLSLGLASEAGEVAGKVKKWLRDGGELDRHAVASELGDVLWYVAQLADDMGYDLSEIADVNLRKLFGRKLRGTLQGSGDDR